MARKNRLYTEVVYYIAIILEYLNTLARGIAYCVDVSGIDNAVVKELYKNVSICMSSIYILNVYKIY